MLMKLQAQLNRAMRFCRSLEDGHSRGASRENRFTGGGVYAVPPVV